MLPPGPLTDPLPLGSATNRQQSRRPSPPTGNRRPGEFALAADTPSRSVQTQVHTHVSTVHEDGRSQYPYTLTVSAAGMLMPAATGCGHVIDATKDTTPAPPPSMRTSSQYYRPLSHAVKAKGGRQGIFPKGSCATMAPPATPWLPRRGSRFALTCTPRSDMLPARISLCRMRHCR